MGGGEIVCSILVIRWKVPTDILGIRGGGEGGLFCKLGVRLRSIILWVKDYIICIPPIPPIYRASERENVVGAVRNFIKESIKDLFLERRMGRGAMAIGGG